MGQEQLILIVFSLISIVFLVSFFRFIYNIICGISAAKTPVVKEKFTQEELDRVVTLTEGEQRKMTRGLVFVVVVSTLLLGGITVSLGSPLRDFIIDGEKVSATVLDIDSYRSGGKRNTIRYRYTLEAVVDGAVVRDIYSAGSYRGASIGDTVSAYATNEARPKLAIAMVLYEGAVLLLIIIAIYGVVLFAMKTQYDKIQTGQMTIRDFSKSSRRKKLNELNGTNTADGKRMYTIND